MDSVMKDAMDVATAFDQQYRVEVRELKRAGLHKLRRDLDGRTPGTRWQSLQLNVQRRRVAAGITSLERGLSRDWERLRSSRNGVRAAAVLEQRIRTATFAHRTFGVKLES